MKLHASVQNILVSIFRLGLLRLSAGTYEATSSTAANVVSHLERFWPTSFQFGNVQKAFHLSLRGKVIANILQFLGRRESKLVRKNCQSCFTMVLQKKILNKNVLNALLNVLLCYCPHFFKHVNGYGMHLFFWVFLSLCFNQIFFYFFNTFFTWIFLRWKNFYAPLH